MVSVDTCMALGFVYVDMVRCCTTPPPPRTLPALGYDKQTVVMQHIWKNRNERPNVGGVSIRSRNGAPSRKGCVVNGQITKASNK